eukprot:g3447.t1
MGQCLLSESKNAGVAVSPPTRYPTPRPTPVPTPAPTPVPAFKSSAWCGPTVDDGTITTLSGCTSTGADFGLGAATAETNGEWKTGCFIKDDGKLYFADPGLASSGARDREAALGYICNWMPCAAGRYRDEDYVLCKSCAAGRYADQARQMACKTCAVGLYNKQTAQTAASACKNCAQGRYIDQTGQAACKSCAVGLFNDQTAQDAASDCKNCAVGKYNDQAGQDAAADCKNCAVGLFNDQVAQDAAADCKKCATGLYNDQTGQDAASDCKGCAIGKFNDQVAQDAAGDCKNCAVGLYQDVTGQAACKNCAVGLYNDQLAQGAAADCKNCAVGLYNDQEAQAAATGCKKCAAGLYNDQQALAWAPVLGRTNLTGPHINNGCGNDPAPVTVRLGLGGGDWIVGLEDRCGATHLKMVKIRVTGASTFDWVENKYDRHPYWGDDKRCIDPARFELGCYTSSPGIITAGKDAYPVQLDAEVRCKSCPAGKYSDQAAATGCKSCTRGEYNAVPAQAACEKCARGTFSTRPAQTVCVGCPSGLYGDQTGQHDNANCKSCPVGKFGGSAGMVQWGHRFMQIGDFRFADVDCERNATSKCWFSISSRNGWTAQLFSNINHGNSPPGGKRPYEGPVSWRGQPYWDMSEVWRRPINESAAQHTIAFGDRFLQIGSWRLYDRDGTHFSVCSTHTTNPTNAIIYRSDATVHGGYAAHDGYCPSGASARTIDPHHPSAPRVGPEYIQIGAWRIGVAGFWLKTQTQLSSSWASLSTDYGYNGGDGTNAVRIWSDLGKVSSGVSGFDCFEQPMCPTGPTTPCLYNCSATPSPTCTSCLLGTFSKRTGTRLKCDDCTAGHYSDRAGATACRHCPAGRYGDQLALTTATSCKNCTAGRYNSLMAQDDASDCKACAAGKLADREGQPLCSNCTAGRFADQSAQTACKGNECAAGTFGAVGQTAVESATCAVCELSTFQALGGQASCYACPFGKRTVERGATSFGECKCDGASCCGPGLIYQGGTCLSCSAGEYQDLSGQTSCKECPRGQFQTDEGKTFCNNCPSGRHGGASGSGTEENCLACGSGRFLASVGGTECPACPAATYQPSTGQAACLGCQPGSWSDVAATACTQCARGRFGDTEIASSSQAHCSKCGASSFQPQAGRTFCLPATACVAGKYEAASPTTSSDRTCALCAAGQYSTGGEKSIAGCTKCERGKYQDGEGQSFCHTKQPCVPGKYDSNPAEESSARCRQCAVGHFSNDVNLPNCTACDASKGEYQVQPGQTYCLQKTACVPGKFESIASRLDEGRCHGCVPGRFAREANARACTACDANKGEFQPQANQTFCRQKQQCVPGKFESDPARFDEARCRSCAPGQFSSAANAQACVKCPEGKRQPAAGKPFCENIVPCEPGSYREGSAVNGTCVACPAGYFCAADRRRPCGGGGFFCPINSTTPTAQPQAVLITAQEGCLKGQFARNGTECVACPSEGVDCIDGNFGVRDNFFLLGSETGNVSLGAGLHTARCRADGVCTTVVDQENIVARTVCSGNTHGLLCGACEAGHGKSVGKCVECPSPLTTRLYVCLFAMIALVFAGTIVKKSLKPDFDSAVISVLRIGLNFVMSTGFLSQLQLDWGSVVRRTFDIAKATSGGVPPLVSCLGVTFTGEMAVSFALPMMVPALPAVVLAVWAAWTKVRELPSGVQWTIAGVAPRHFFVNACVALFFLVWPALTVQTLRTFDCSVQVGEIWYLASDVTVKCYGAEHMVLHTIAFVQLFLVLPSLPAFVLWRLRKAGAGQDTWNQKHLYFLYGGYREGFEFWE